MTTPRSPDIDSLVQAGVYVRISRDELDDHKGVARQEEDGRKVATAEGMAVYTVYSDNDISAYSGKIRPAYERMMADVRAGVIQAIIAQHPDRLHRSPRELEAFITAVDEAKCQVITAQAGYIDLSNSNGRMMARMAGVVARHESEHKSERILRKFQEKREKGEWTGGARPYGYEADGVTIRQDEAAIIRELVARVLAGENLNALTADLNRRGITTAKRGPWRRSNLQHMLVGGRISGRYQRAASKGVAGEIVGPAVWSGIISVEDSERVRSLCSGPKPKGRNAKYLLTGGISKCGRCGRPLTVSHRSIATQTRLNCQKWDPSDQTACGGSSIVYGPVESFIADAVLHRVESGALDRLVRGLDTGTLDELIFIERELGEIGNGVRWQAQRAPLLARKRELERQAQPAQVDPGFDGLPDPLRPAWPELEMGRKRAIVQALIEVVVLHPATKFGRGNVDLGRVEIRWKS
jgi:DNA invertase Pin-like site-specific DNA recombinase